MKVGDENGISIINIIYGNNQFELVDLFDNVSNNMDFLQMMSIMTPKKIMHVLWTQMMNKKINYKIK